MRVLFWNRYSKPVTPGHTIGFSLFVLSIVGGVYLKSQKDKLRARNRKDSADAVADEQ